MGIRLRLAQTLVLAAHRIVLQSFSVLLRLRIAFAYLVTMEPKDNVQSVQVVEIVLELEI